MRWMDGWNQILSELPVELTFPLLFGSILHVIVGLNAEPFSKLYGFLGQSMATFNRNALRLMCTSMSSLSVCLSGAGVLGLHTLASSSFGMMLSSIAPTTETALAIGNRETMDGISLIMWLYVCVYVCCHACRSSADGSVHSLGWHPAEPPDALMAEAARAGIPRQVGLPGARHQRIHVSHQHTHTEGMK